MKELLIGFGGVALGFLLSFGGDAVRSWLRNRKTKKSVAGALLVEIVSQAHWCARRGNAWNIYAANAKSVRLRAVRRDRPPEAPLYGALAGQITLLDAKDASKASAFHGAVGSVRAWIDALEGEGESHSVSGAEAEDLAMKWRAACFNGLLAINALEPIAKISPMPNDEHEISELKTDLDAVAAGGIIQAAQGRDSAANN